MGVTIKDVAKECEVSIATVSRVLNDTAYVEDELKQKVYEAVKKLNYYPNSIAKNLKKGSTLTIAFVVSDFSNDYYTSVATSIENVIHEHNYNMVIYASNGDGKSELNILKELMSNRIDGLIINTTGKNDDLIIELSKKLPIILINRKLKLTGFDGDFFGSNNIEAMHTLVAHLLSLGHRNIGIINGSMDVNTGLERYQGFKNAMLDAGIDLPEDYCYKFDGDFSEESGYHGASALMSKLEPPTAIVVSNNDMTLGALKYMRLHRINIPEEVTISCFGSIKNIELLFVRPNIMVMDPRVIGKEIGERIIKRLINNNLENCSVIFESKLVEGDFTKLESHAKK